VLAGETNAFEIRRILTDELRRICNNLAEHHQKGLGIAELTWVKLGSPTERKSLITSLENVIVRCIDEGAEYPPILLKRKKELERGNWEPKRSPEPAQNLRAILECPRIGFAKQTNKADEISMRNSAEPNGRVRVGKELSPCGALVFDA
jgi:hypothetical protein